MILVKHKIIMIEFHSKSRFFCFYKQLFKEKIKLNLTQKMRFNQFYQFKIQCCS